MVASSRHPHAAAKPILTGGALALGRLPEAHPAALGVAGIVLGAFSAAATARSTIVEAPATMAVARGLVPVLYTVVGASVWPRRATSRIGGVLAAVGLTYALTTPVVSESPVWHSLGRLAYAAWLALFAYAFLAYPLGYLAGRRERLLMRGYIVVAGLLWAALALTAETLPAAGALTACGTRCPRNGLRVVDAPAWVTHVVEGGIVVATTVLLVGLIVVLARRALSRVVVVRLTIGPPLIAAVALTTGYLAYTAHPTGHAWWAACAALTIAGALACPVCFGIGPLVAELFVSRSLMRSVARLDPARMTSDDIERVCRRALGDTSARLSFIRLEAEGSSWVLLGDPALMRGYERVVDTVERLAVTLAECSHLLGGLRSSRRRIAEQETHERARLERDLHDGAQQRLLALQMKLADLAEDLQGSQLERSVAAIAREAATASAEVRTISHGIYPSLLVERGLVDSVRSLPASLSMPIEVIADEVPRVSLPTERAVYFAVTEAVHNAMRHSSAKAIAVHLGRREDTLEVVVRDEGSGFVPGDARTSPGLLGLRDRIESVGGTAEISSTAGKGTTVTLRVPLDA